MNECIYARLIHGLDMKRASPLPPGEGAYEAVVTEIINGFHCVSVMNHFQINP
jgi:hypothetical protein